MLRIFTVLAQRPIRRLWTGQLLSAIGDEIYAIALVWYATDLIGVKAGYVTALQAGAVFIFSLLGGLWIDHRDLRKVMINTDLARGAVVLLLPLATLFMPINLWLLIPVSVT